MMGNVRGVESNKARVSGVSIPTLLMWRPQSWVMHIWYVGDADLAMRSVQKVNIPETRWCNRQRRRKLRYYQTRNLVFTYSHVGVSSGHASNHKCRDLRDSPGHASVVLLRFWSSEQLLSLVPERNDVCSPKYLLLLGCVTGAAAVLG